MTDVPATLPHVGLTVTDPEVSRQWYQRLFNAAPVLAEDVPAVPEHHQGFHKVVFVLSGGFVLGLIAHPATDRSQVVGNGDADAARMQPRPDKSFTLCSNSAGAKGPRPYNGTAGQPPPAQPAVGCRR